MPKGLFVTYVTLVNYYTVHHLHNPNIVSFTSFLTQQVQNKVVFPKYPKVSQPCRSLIARILVPQSTRLCISNIKTNSWLETSVVAQTSISGRFIVRFNRDINARSYELFSHSYELFLRLIISFISCITENSVHSAST